MQCESAKRAIRRWWAGRLSDDEVSNMEWKKKEVEIVGIAYIHSMGIFPIYRAQFPNLHSYFREKIGFSLLRIILLRDKIYFSLLRVILLMDKIWFYLLRIIL